MRLSGVNNRLGNDPRAKAAATVARGDTVLFRWERGEALARIEEKATRIEGLGVLKETTVVGIPFGTKITIGAQTVYLIRPTLPDYLRLLKRGAQIITPKDAGLILLNCGIGAGADPAVEQDEARVLRSDDLGAAFEEAQVIRQRGADKVNGLGPNRDLRTKRDSNDRRFL